MPERKIKPFLFEGEITVRVIDRDGAPWFVATDVCRALGILNAADTVRGLDEDEKGIDTTDTLGGHQEAVVISESGLYSLIFKSRKPNAVRFRKWVTTEVLPTLRRTGSYAIGGVSFGGGRKPYEDWSLDETRVALSEVNTARLTLNQASAAWIWGYVGLPIPPRHLLPAWWQADLLTPTIDIPPA
jgi:prophage antirepressor-like protein